MPAGDLIDRLVEKEEQDRLLRAMGEDFQRLRQNPEAWAEFQAETAAWDTTSSDGAQAVAEARLAETA